MTDGTRPPAWLRRLLWALLPREDRGPVLHEMDVLYRRRVAGAGRVRADMWYAVQVPSFATRLFVYRVFRRDEGPRVQEPVQGRLSGLLDATWRNVRSAVRGLVRVPLYSIASVATLGIGVAAISSVHAVANWGLLRPVPGVGAPEELVTILLGTTQGTASWPISDPDFRIIADRTQLLSALAGATDQDVHVARPRGAPERVRGQIVTAGYFEVLDVGMVAGRWFTTGEATGRDEPHVLVLSEPFAKRWYGIPDRAVGEDVIVNGLPYTVVGVTGHGFRGNALPATMELWIPGGALPDVLHDPDVLRQSGRQVWATLIGRPNAGVAAAAVEAEMNALMEAIRREKAGQNHSFLANHFRFRVYPGIGLPPSLRAPTTRTLSILAGAAALLLLLACANVTNLGLARAASLSSGIVVRRALGASGAAIGAERIIESALAGLAGGAVGVLLGVAVIAGLRTSGLGLLGVPLDGVSLSPRVVVVTVIAGVLSGILAGLLPALVSRGERATSVLRIGTRADRATGRTGRLLVVAQVALSVVLLVGGVLLARTLDNLRRVDLGVDDTGVIEFALDPGLQGYEQAATTSLIHELTTGVMASGGFESVAAAWSPPFEGLHVPYSIKRPDGDWERDGMIARSFLVTPGLFDVLGIELIAGRTFREDETWSESEPVVILNESAARSAYPDLGPSDVVGRFVDQRGREDTPVRVVGVVRDARLERPADTSREYVFVPWAQGFDIGRFTVYARTPRSLEAVSPVIRDLMGSIDPTLPVHGMRTLHAEIRSLLAEQRLVATLALGLAAFGLLLAAVGLYGVLALAVTRRTREIGIRNALGAQPRRTLATVVGSGLAMAIIGVAPGIVAGAWLSRVLESRLYGLGHLDAASYVIGCTALVAVALVASWLPARRAMRVDPMVALRHQE